MDPTPSNIEHIYSLLPSIIASMPSPDQVTHRNIRFGLASKLNLARVSFEGKGEDGWANVIRKEVMRLLEVRAAGAQCAGEAGMEGGKMKNGRGRKLKLTLPSWLLAPVIHRRYPQRHREYHRRKRLRRRRRRRTPRLVPG